MLDKFLVLLERFVVAHELIAANSAKQTTEADTEALRRITTETVSKALAANYGNKELPVEGEDVIDTKAVKDAQENAEAAEIRAAIEEEEEQERKEKAKERKPRQTKPKDEPKGPDVEKLREEIKTIAKAIAAGDSDECADKFDELLEDYKVRTVTKLTDEDVEAFHKDATKLVGKYYEIED